ncbi:isochorismatase family protein [Nocardioides sp. zg-1228]|uniref:isochorismatase family protein n=1 Tax=Nocardioides sp. zg-1228 TaxID=2763008 RepID=UPI0016428057|nr:isochorismatase family protein [Nocardioides sp. zg-1228]MBC2934165.1 isochorismatase family protein [Nocardioides sp. zg-1228]QSF58910.1 isochorismatase family protein [Nocardioides sp. zg-1228]
MGDQPSEAGTPQPFGGSLRPGAVPAVLAVDMMRAYFDPASALCLPSDACLDSAARVLACARQQGVPVVHTRVRYAAGGADGGVFFRKVPALRDLVGDGPMGELVPQVAPSDDELVVVKQYASAFFGTTLASTLHAWGVDTVVVVGVSTSGCIRASAVDAVQHGFVPLVVADAVGDREPGPHHANLHDLSTKYAEVVDEATALAYLADRPAPGAPA